jgi:hypothetical protein
MITKLDQLVQNYLCNRTNDHPKFIESNGLQKIIDNIEEELVEVLPHGGGIDCKWNIEKKGNGLDFVCSNSFHVMDQNGYYCGYVDFSVYVNVEKPWHSLNVEVSQTDIDAIYSEYDVGAEATDEEIEEWNEVNACPYLDELEDDIFETVKYSLELYYISEAVKRAKQFYPYLLEKA